MTQKYKCRKINKKVASTVTKEFQKTDTARVLKEWATYFETQFGIKPSPVFLGVRKTLVGFTVLIRV